MNLRIKGGQIMKTKNLPVIICSNHSIVDGYSKAKHVSVNALETRFEQIDLYDKIDLDNIEWEEPTEDPVNHEKDEEEDNPQIIYDSDENVSDYSD